MHRIRYRRILATFGGAAALSFLLAACSSNATESHSPKPHVTHSAKATPTPTPTPTVDSSEIFQTEPIAEAPAIVQQLEAMPMDTPEQVAAFNAIPKEDQLTWLSWATNNNIQGYAAAYYETSLDPNDIYPTTPISVNSNPQDILTVGDYWIRAARSMPTAADAQKALIASLTGGMQDPAYGPELAILRLDIVPWRAITPAWDALSHSEVGGTVTSASSMTSDTQGRPSLDINYSYSGANGEGITVSGSNTVNAVIYTFSDFKGQQETTALTGGK